MSTPTTSSLARPIDPKPTSSRQGESPPIQEDDGISPEEAYQALQKVGAILEGHFQYESERHGEIYVEKFRILENPGAVELLGRAIASAFEHLEIALVVGPTTGGWLVAYETARAVSGQVRAFCAEPASEGGRAFRRGFTFQGGEKVLVVDDVLTTGGSLRDTINAVRAGGGDPVAVGVIVDRTNGAAAPADKFEGLEFFSCLPIDVASYDPRDCPLCKAGESPTIT